jgi:hypothetical protein
VEAGNSSSIMDRDRVCRGIIIMQGRMGMGRDKIRGIVDIMELDLRVGGFILRMLRRKRKRSMLMMKAKAWERVKDRKTRREGQEEEEEDIVKVMERRMDIIIKAGMDMEGRVEARMGIRCLLEWV